MAVFMNAKGTQSSVFQLGKRGNKIFGSTVTPTASECSTGDLWFDISNNETKIASKSGDTVTWNKIITENFGDVKVTFQVDMQNVNVSGTGVWISGGSISSASPSGIQMQRSNTSGLWEAQLTLPPSSNFTYKFRNGYFPNSWSEGWEVISDNCAVGQYNDRSVSIGVADTTLPSVCFNMCAECIQ